MRETAGAKTRTVKGVVVRTTAVSEYDKIMTVYTEDSGLVSVYVNGARVVRSKNLFPTQAFSYSTFVLYEKNDRYWLKESEAHFSFYHLKMTIEETSLATYFCDVVYHTAMEGITDVPYFRLISNALYAISRRIAPLDKIKAAFEWKAADILGFCPNVEECAQCGEKEGDFYLNVNEGNMICTSCKENMNFEQYIPAEYQDIPYSVILGAMDASLLAIVRYLLHCPLERMLAFQAEASQIQELARLSEKYLLYHIDMEFKPLELYHRLSKENL